MRFSTVLSFLVAVILAGAAVYGTQVYMEAERQQLSAAALRQIEEQQQQEEQAPERTLVVANEPFSFGERVTPAKLREIEWSSDVLPNGSFAKIEEVIVDDTEEEARFAVTSIEVGEPILASKITIPGQRAKLSTALTPGRKAVSIRVNDVLGVAGFVLPGDRVDVMLTRGRGGSAYVDVLLQGVKVLAIDQTADDRKDSPSVVRTVTFEVNTEEAQKLTLGATVGTLSLALRNLSSPEVEKIDRITLQDLNEIDVAEELEEEIVGAGEGAETAEAEEAVPSEELERLNNLESLLKGLASGLEERIDGVEQKIQQPEPAIVEKEVVKEVVVEKLVVPERRTVGVIRNGSRSEYKVDVEEDQTSEEEEATLDQDGEALPTE